MIEVDAVIVGARFSGTAVAAQLARRIPPSFCVAIFEPSEPGRGAAYLSEIGRQTLLGAFA